MSVILPEINKIEGWFFQQDVDMLYPYVSKLKPNSLLVEIGTYHGKSTLFFRLANPKIKILTIDVCDKTGINPKYDNGHIIIPEHIDEEVLKYGNIFQIKGNSHEVVKTFNWKIDFLFLDSLHTYDDLLQELNEWKVFLKPKSYIACHDYTSAFPDVIQAVADSHITRVEYKNGIAILQP
jgi:cephalosporin hydroxylase